MIKSLFDVLSDIPTKRNVNDKSYFFDKNSFDDSLIVGDGFFSTIYSDSTDYEKSFYTYKLHNLYKFDLSSYKMMEQIKNPEIVKLTICRPYKNAERYETKKFWYFIGVIDVNAFGKRFSLGNGILQTISKDELEKWQENGMFGKFLPFNSTNYTNQMPYYPNNKDKDFAYYYPGTAQSAIGMLKNLEQWAIQKDLVTDAEFTYIKKCKAYLDDLLKHRKTYESQDYLRKQKVLKLFGKTK